MSKPSLNSLAGPSRLPFSFRSARPRSIASPPCRASPASRPAFTSLLSSARRPAAFRPMTLFMAIPPLLTLGLGIWQVQRLDWKRNLIDEVERNLNREPMVLPNNINLAALPDFAFRRVLLHGEYQSPPMLLGPQVKDGVPGYALILPFSRASSGGSTILVNRGFITTTRAAAIRSGEIPPPGLGEGEVVVEGMLSKRFGGGKKGTWEVENKPETNEWFWRDVEGMSQWAGGEERGVQPVLVDAIDYGEQPASLLMAQGVPVGRPPTIELRNQHATYAMTWFSLCAATTGMFVYMLRKSKRPQLPMRRR